MNRSAHPIEREEVMAYLDGELPPARAAAVAGHLEQCVACQALATDLRLISQRLLAWQAEPAPAGLTEGAVIAAGKSAVLGVGVKPARIPIISRWRLLALRPWTWAALGALAMLLLVIAMGVPFLTRRAAPERLGTLLGVESAEQRKQADEYSHSLRTEVLGAPVGGESAEQPSGPMIAQRASLTIVAQKFDQVRGAVEQIISGHQGYVAELTVSQLPGNGRTLTATLRVPADQLEAALAELKKLGSVEQESHSAEDVSRPYVDLVARLKNARATEQRLLDLLRQRTGKVSDVLQVEEEISRVREEIEQMEAERKTLERRVNYATIHLRVSEEYRAELGSLRTSIRTRLWNAVADGYHTGVESVLAVLLFLVTYGPTLLFWALILFWPARFAWRRWRAAHPQREFHLGAQ